MEDGAQSAANFFIVCERNGFHAFHRQMIARDIPGEYMKLITQKPLSSKNLMLFKHREDITDICRLEEKRLEEMTGSPVTINEHAIEMLFLWNRSFHKIYKVPSTIERWERFFKMDTSKPCAICMEQSDKKTVCPNCTAIVCLDCDKKIEENRCPMCTSVSV